MPVSPIAYSRHMKLLDILKRKGFSRVEELSEMLEVSPVTIRRDLDYLHRKGLLERRRGGADIGVSVSKILPEQDFSEKGAKFAKEKAAIARKAQDYVSDNDIIFLNSGSTSLHFLKALQNSNLKIFTNNAWAITCDYDSSIELMILGGEYREQSRSFVGIMALDAIKNVISHKTFLGTNGISFEKGLTTNVQQECSINKEMIKNTSGEVVVLADSSKIGHISNFISTSLEKIDILITDDGCSSDQTDSLERAGVKVIIA